MVTSRSCLILHRPSREGTVKIILVAAPFLHI